MAETAPIIDKLVIKAVVMGADALEIEYRHPEERVLACKGPTAVGIGSFRGEEGDALRRELWALRRRKPRLVIDGIKYSLSLSTFDSFGETAFRVTITKLPTRRTAQRPAR